MDPHAIMGMGHVAWLGLALLLVPFAFAGLALVVEIVSHDEAGGSGGEEESASHKAAPAGHVDG